jgi:arsenate reductase (thioredoxin)
MDRIGLPTSVEEEPMRYVLFVCNHNAGRSQMAQAFFERLAPPDLRAESAGTEPAGQIWPAVVEVMREAGIDISDRRPKKLTREMQLDADLAVTMGCGDACPYVPTTVLEWDIPDPAGKPLAEVRGVRDIVEERVRTLLAQKLEEIRSEATEREQRPGRGVPPPVKKLEGKVALEEIRACADAVLARLDKVSLHTRVVTLGSRETRERLRHQHGDALAPSA